jgi:hypothetical protein
MLALEAARPVLFSTGTGRSSDASYRTGKDQLGHQRESISKQNADAIFGMNRRTWESYAKQMTHPLGWRSRLLPQETGTAFAAFDPATGTGLTVQPLFSNDTDPPDMIVFSSWYPVGRLPLTPDFVTDVERVVQRDLGPGYSVSASTAKLPGLEGIELMVNRKR